MKQTIYTLLEGLSISYEKIDHPPVYTSEQARQLIPPRPAASAKNLFLKDKKGRNHYLLVFEDSKTLRFEHLAEQIGSSRLSLASLERLERHLGVDPGAVSLLALMNDRDQKVRLLVDRDLWEKEALQCHPLDNTATLVISMGDIRRFLHFTGHSPRLVIIPSRET